MQIVVTWSTTQSTSSRVRSSSSILISSRPAVVHQPTTSSWAHQDLQYQHINRKKCLGQQHLFSLVILWHACAKIQVWRTSACKSDSSSKVEVQWMHGSYSDPWHLCKNGRMMEPWTENYSKLRSLIYQKNLNLKDLCYKQYWNKYCQAKINDDKSFSNIIIGNCWCGTWWCKCKWIV